MEDSNDNTTTTQVFPVAGQADPTAKGERHIGFGIARLLNENTYDGSNP